MNKEIITPQSEQEVTRVEEGKELVHSETQYAERSQEIIEDITERSEIPSFEDVVGVANSSTELDPSDIDSIIKEGNYDEKYSSITKAIKELNEKTLNTIESIRADDQADASGDNIAKNTDETKPDISPISQLKLSKIEKYQAERRMGQPTAGGGLESEYVNIHFFQTHPEIRQAIASNPFSEGAALKEAITSDETAFDVNDRDSIYKVARASILAEPEGQYEKTFKQLPRREQANKLYEQIETSSEMTLRLQRYIDEHIDEISHLPDADLYNDLSKVAFGTDNEEDIQAQFALSQRRGFRLSIAHFLETRSTLSGYQKISEDDPKAFAENILHEKFSGNITIESLPFGFIISMDEEDYALIQSADRSPKSIPSSGVTLWERVPDELQGRVVLLNKGGAVGGIPKKERLDITRKHEIRHILFSDFHSQQETKLNTDTEKDLESCKTEQDYKNVSETLLTDFVERAKDEIIAYYSGGQLDVSITGLRFRDYNSHIDKAKSTIEQRSDLSEEDKIALKQMFDKDHEKGFQTIRRIRFIAEKLTEQSEKGLIDKDKAEALLRNTSGTKIERLVRYTGLSNEEFREDRALKEQDKAALSDLEEVLNVPDQFEEEWWNKAYKAIKNIQKLMPPESLPKLLQTAQRWSEKDWTSYYAEEAVLLVNTFIDCHGVSLSEKRKIREELDAILNKLVGETFNTTGDLALDVYNKVNTMEVRTYDLSTSPTAESEMIKEEADERKSSKMSFSKFKPKKPPTSGPQA